jgi:hypothetical protein
MSITRTVSLLLITCATACGTRNGGIDDPISLLDNPVALNDHIVLVDDEGDRAFILGVMPSGPSASPQIVELPHDPRTATRRNGANEALILSMGRRATSHESAQPAVLTALSSSGKTRRYELGENPFDTLKQSDDGRYVFLFKDANTERLLDNPNEVAIIDLSKPPGKTSINLRTLRSFGDSPSTVVFAPSMNIVGEDRRLAVVLSNTNVTLIDLDHLDRLETTVQLSRAPGQSPVKPEQVLFNPERSEIYVRGGGSNDIFVFSLTARAPEASDAAESKPHNDFRPSIDQLGVGGQPTDMALYATKDGTRLLVLSGEAQQAAIVDAATSQITTVDLPVVARSLLLFKASSPRGDANSQRAMLYQPSGTSVVFLDLADLEQRGSRNVEVLELSASIEKLVPIVDQQRLLVIHAGIEGVSLIDLAGRTVSPITSNVALDNATFDPARLRLWVGPTDQNYVGWLDLSTGDTQELLLDEAIGTLVPMLSVGKIAVLHQSDVGHLTVLDAAKPRRDTAHSVRGFLVADLLERGH